MKASLKNILLLICTISLAACSAAKDEEGDRGPDDETIPFDVEAEGHVNGQRWAYKSGSAEIVMRSGRPFLFIRLWNEVIADPCNKFSGSDLDVRILVPNMNGRYQIRTDHSNEDDPAVIFGDQRELGQPQNNMIADQGVVEILTNQGQVTGGLSSSFHSTLFGNNQVAGSFAVELCP